MEDNLFRRLRVNKGNGTSVTYICRQYQLIPSAKHESNSGITASAASKGQLVMAGIYLPKFDLSSILDTLSTKHQR